MKQPQEGTYAISEVGDLGLGLTPINEDMTEQGESEMEREKGAKSLI